MARDERFRSIGVIRTPFPRGEGAPVQGAGAPDTEGTVEIDAVEDDLLTAVKALVHVG